MHYVACSMCGGVVGVVDYYAVGTIARHVAKAVIAIARRVGAIVDSEAESYINGL